MTVYITKPAINLREKLSDLERKEGLVGLQILGSDTSAEAIDALNLEDHTFVTFRSTGIDDNATSTKLTVSNTGIDVTGTVTADGLTVSGGDALAKIEGTAASLILNETDAVDQNTRLRNTVGDFLIQTVNDAVTAATDRIRIDHATGDISFYEDTGTTPKFFWDASAESLGIGTSSPSGPLTVANSSNTLMALDSDSNRGRLRIYRSGATAYTQLWHNGANGDWSTSVGDLTFTVGGSERMRIDSSGNVGIGTSSPKSNLDVAGSTGIYQRHSSGGSLVFDDSDTADASTPMSYIRNTAGTLEFGRSDRNASTGLTTNSAESMRIDASGNVLIGGTTAGTASAGNLVLVNGTAPTGNVTDGITLYAEDVSSSSELKVRDEAGNVTTLSPHNFDLIPEGPSEDMAWSYYSERDGKRINVDMLKAIRLLEQITGEKLVHMA